MNKKKILLIIIPIILVLAIVSIGLTIYFATDIFKSADKLFAKYFAQNEDIFEVLKNENINEQKKFKESNTYEITGDLNITIQNGATTRMINGVTSSRHDANTKRTYSDITIKNENTDLINLSYINSDDVYAIKSDAIIGNYIGVRNSNLKTFAKNLGISEQDIQSIPDSIDFSSIANMVQISQEEKQYIADTYLRVIFETIEKDDFKKLGTTQIFVDSKSYDVNAYKVDLDAETITQMLINCLTTLKDDNKTLVIISNQLSNLGISKEYTDITYLSNTINNFVEQYQTETNNTDERIAITVYENKSNTIRTEISFSNETKITIDRINTNNISKVIVSIQMPSDLQQTLSISEENVDSPNMNLEQNENTSMINNFQISFQKSIDSQGITNEIVIVPDVNNIEESITITTTMGNLNQDIINNTSDITISSFSDGVSTQTIQTSYSQNMQKLEQVEEIMQLQNSNTIIFNNYNLEQLTPFLTRLGDRVKEVLPNKFAQLGLALTVNQDGSGLESINNNLNSIIAVGTAGFGIANANGLDTSGMTSLCGIGIGMYIYQMSAGTIQNTNLSTQEVTAYNANFDKYEGTQTGSTVRGLVDVIRSHNAFDDDLSHQIIFSVGSALDGGTVADDNAAGTTPSALSTLKSQITAGGRYNITFQYTSGGLIKQIDATLVS